MSASSDIFASDAAPTPSCHASTIAECDGRLLAAWFGGEYEKHPRVTIWMSSLERDGWSPPREIANGRGADGKSLACWNPVLFKMPDGPLLLFYKVGAEIARWRTQLKLSRDGGLSWSAPRDLGDGIAGPVKNKPVMLGDTLLCPSSTEPDWHHWILYMSRCDDVEGDWQRIGPLSNPAEVQAIQPTILIHPGGRLQALCRTRNGFVGSLWSDDGGSHWTSPQPTSLPNPNSGIDGVTLKDGRHLLVYNHSRKARTPLNIGISEDGLDWRMAHTLESAEGEYSYPAAIQAANGRVCITYTKNRRTIGYVEWEPPA